MAINSSVNVGFEAGGGNKYNFPNVNNDTLVLEGATQTLTNKTIDVDNNTISNIEVDNFKGSAIVTEAKGIASNDNDTTIPTSAAVKDYVDNNSGGGGSYKFAIAGTIGATGTNVANTILVNSSVTFTSCNLRYGTAGSGTLTVDINKNGTTLFSSTKPSITTTNQTSVGTGILTTTTAVQGDLLTIDIDAVPGTKGVDLYVELFYS